MKRGESEKHGTLVWFAIYGPWRKGKWLVWSYMMILWFLLGPRHIKDDKLKLFSTFGQ
ncbi:hypothetical protein RchiOBHm_Chr1g0374831 [Rosa chinensis]|uniref:Uncharacterized protein n=1 Tax=Rosa chinensis TaxID=74649 RepID=A0A2P6SMG9_ROSCH|nr:hypothetical protein RchiOBHm_Chr1g0374831 [Rosa chinensis]